MARMSVVALLATLGCSEPPPAEAPAAPVPVQIAQSDITDVEASSFLQEERSSFPAAHAIDGDRTTAWCEGVEGLGAGEALTVTLKSATEIAEIRVDGGFFKDDRTLTNNGRPRKVVVASDAGWSKEIVFPFVAYREFRAAEVKEKPRSILNPGKAKVLTFTLLEADEGRFTKDVCISEIALFKAP